LIVLAKNCAVCAKFRHHHGGEPLGRALSAAVRAEPVRRARHLQRADDRGVLPFVVVNFLALLVITYVPAISMVLLGHAR
jgi:TRAP-type C4-dicarboxylate transport system permease large subunit